MKTAADIIETNKKQKEFYNDIRQNFLTRMWARVRNGVLNKVRKSIGVQDQAYALHLQWFGDLSGKKVLDLGCFSGNYWSRHLAAHSARYLGIDLSDVAIGKLQKALEPYPNADVKAVDFLSPDFTEDGFDLIYAYGVLHHFSDTDILIARLREKLAPDGQIISYDPLQTSLPVKILRTLYRPFQSDAAWEWPFTRKTYSKFASAFDILERRGILGKAKWSVLLHVLPVSERWKEAKGKSWHRDDWEASVCSDRRLFECMHLTMLMQNRPA